MFQADLNSEIETHALEPILRKKIPKKVQSEISFRETENSFVMEEFQNTSEVP